MSIVPAGMAGAARIGPNAIIQVADAVQAAAGGGVTAELFAAAGLTPYLRSPPAGMVDEREVIRLHAALRARLPADDVRRIVRHAGAATGDYLLANRIPAIAQWVLRALPAGLASRALLAAIAKHSWTFAGSGTFTARPADRRTGRPVTVAIGDCPLCRGAHADAPICDYYAATFERLFRRLVAPAAVATETGCSARGDAACTFAITW